MRGRRVCVNHFEGQAEWDQKKWPCTHLYRFCLVRCIFQHLSQQRGIDVSLRRPINKVGGHGKRRNSAFVWAGLECRVRADLGPNSFALFRPLFAFFQTLLARNLFNCSFSFKSPETVLAQASVDLVLAEFFPRRDSAACKQQKKVLIGKFGFK